MLLILFLLIKYKYLNLIFFFHNCLCSSRSSFIYGKRTISILITDPLILMKILTLKFCKISFPLSNNSYCSLFRSLTHFFSFLYEFLTVSANFAVIANEKMKILSLFWFIILIGTGGQTVLLSRQHLLDALHK